MIIQIAVRYSKELPQAEGLKEDRKGLDLP